MNELNELIDLGLPEREAKVYLALLQLGQSGAKQLLKKTGLYRVILYDTLECLIEKGFVSFFELNGRKQFVPENPSKLLEEIKLKESLAIGLVSRLENFKEPLPETAFKLYNGFGGIKSAQENYFDEMRKNPTGEYLMMGASFQLHERLDSFFNNFHERRSKLGIKARLVFNPDNKKFGELKKQFRLTKVRYLPSNYFTPSWISMYENILLIGVMDENPLAIFIKNKRIAESYKNYFEIMWKASNAK